MFDEYEDQNCTEEPSAKKIKLDTVKSSDKIHSSLAYSSIKAPPLIEYKSIDSYCENKPKDINESSLEKNAAVSNIKTADFESVSSPIVFKTPLSKGVVRNSKSKPFIFYSVEELSLVRSLKNWSNNKVCLVGKICIDTKSCNFYLHSVEEIGQWQILFDYSLLSVVTPIGDPLQIFGTLEVENEIPRIKAIFFRCMKLVDLSLLTESYKLMDKFVPLSVQVDIEKEPMTKNESVNSIPEFNDTLDGIDFSILDYL